ncbi:MAG: hypothetical protein GDA39_03175 [Hyphomonadaceae bacterium]|nr:hypothetical protein [Hyphomonadaceae bacterium]MBC6411955.1 hypothetical protein [Hyphomonadaceae bacterium]
MFSKFDDPEPVRRLCGPNRANLALIEDAFNVYVKTPGSSVHIDGDTPTRVQVGEIVHENYQRLERGRPR